MVVQLGEPVTMVTLMMVMLVEHVPNRDVATVWFAVVLRAAMTAM